MLVNIYGHHVRSNIICKRWFWRFQSGDFDVIDKEIKGALKKLEDAQLPRIIGKAEKGFCIVLLLSMKNGCAPLILSMRKLGEARWNRSINAKIKYSYFEDYIVYMVEQKSIIYYKLLKPSPTKALVTDCS